MLLWLLLGFFVGCFSDGISGFWWWGLGSCGYVMMCCLFFVGFNNLNFDFMLVVERDYSFLCIVIDLLYVMGIIIFFL